MDNKTFVKEIYEPFNEAYKLMKMIKDCGPEDSEETWAEFVTELDAFTVKNDTKIGKIFSRMITDVADQIADMNKKTNEEG